MLREETTNRGSWLYLLSPHRSKALVIWRRRREPGAPLGGQGALITRAGCASSLCSGPAPSLPAEGCGVGSETLAGREALCLQSVAPAPAKQSKIYENVAIWGVLVCLCMVSPNGVESKAFTCPYRQVG